MGLTSWAQNGKIQGQIIDGAYPQETLPFAQITFIELERGLSADENGYFESTVPQGTYTLAFSYIGYQTQMITVQIDGNPTPALTITLQPEDQLLEDVVIVATANRQNESALLMEQQKALVMKQQIGAQEMSRKGLSDVAAAVVKTSGISKQEGSNSLFVRGLGDRYNATTLNGLPVPSNNVERKNIALELFPTDIVEYINIDKVYHSDLYGDFAGGNVDIRTRNHTGQPYLNLSLSSRTNSNALKNSNFQLLKAPNYWGYSPHALPTNPLGSYSYHSLEYKKQAPWAGGLNVTGGASWNLGNNSKLSLFGTIGFDNAYASAGNGAANADINGAGVASKQFHTYTDDQYTTSTTGLLQSKYQINAQHHLQFTSLWVNASKNQTETYRGYVVDFAESSEGLILRNTYTQTQLYTQQLSGKHQWNSRWETHWGVALNQVKDRQPDRSQFQFNQRENGYTINSQSAPNNHRYFQSLAENELAAYAKISYGFAPSTLNEFRGKIHLGYQARTKSREFEATQFNFKTSYSPINYQSTLVNPYQLDDFYNAANFQNHYFTISTFRGNHQVPNALRPQTYTGELTIQAATAAVDYQFSEQLTVIAGLRSENIVQKINWDTQLGGRGKDALTKQAFLPNLQAKYRLNDRHNLRLGASKTYTLPQFKERAVFVYEEVTQVKIGNPDLYESDNYNVDFKWEYFPQREEIIAIGTFGKYIQNPINEVTIASSTNDISYLNTGDYGYVIGAEMEIRKNLLNRASSKLNAGFNVSYLYTDQELDSEKVRKETQYQVDFTHTKSAFTGASDLLLNADLSYLHTFSETRSIQTTLVYSYYSDRVYSLGINQRGNLIEQAVGQLDAIVQTQFTRNLDLRLTVRNLTNPVVQRVQANPNGEHMSLRFTRGTDFNLSLNYRF